MKNRTLGCVMCWYFLVGLLQELSEVVLDLLWQGCEHT